MEKPPVKYVTRRNIGFESSRAHSRVRECVASLTKRKGWLRTSEWAETRNGMSYPLWELSAFILSLPPRPNHRHAIFVPRCKSFYKVFIPILFRTYVEIVSFFLSFSSSSPFSLLRISWTLTNFSTVRCLPSFKRYSFFNCWRGWEWNWIELCNGV